MDCRLPAPRLLSEELLLAAQRRKVNLSAPALQPAESPVELWPEAVCCQTDLLLAESSWRVGWPLAQQMGSRPRAPRLPDWLATRPLPASARMDLPRVRCRHWLERVARQSRLPAHLEVRV